MQPLERKTHWNTYYCGKDVPALPSQFAVFALGEYRPSAVVDIGCGSGRDAFFFASQSIPTIGIDGSESAVTLCQSRADGLPLRFMRMDVTDRHFATTIASMLDGAKGIMAYARFFIHAITEDEETSLLRHVSALIRQHGGLFAVEFRTTRDMSLHKVTPDHYRRFVEPATLIARSASFGFKIIYSTEGFGMAKYKGDDAYVARIIFGGA